RRRGGPRGPDRAVPQDRHPARRGRAHVVAVSGRSTRVHAKGASVAAHAGDAGRGAQHGGAGVRQTRDRARHPVRLGTARRAARGLDPAGPARALRGGDGQRARARALRDEVSPASRARSCAYAASRTRRDVTGRLVQRRRASPFYSTTSSTNGDPLNVSSTRTVSGNVRVVGHEPNVAALSSAPVNVPSPSVAPEVGSEIVFGSA